MSASGSNLLDLSTWTVGSGNVGGFNINGSDAENQRVTSTNPFEEEAVIWEARPDSSSDADGGWATSFYPIDHAQTYRYTVWIKKTGSAEGNTFFGTGGTWQSGYDYTGILELDGTSNGNPYFWVGDLPELGKWYLLVGYVHGSGETSTTNHGRLYDGETGLPLVDLKDYKFDPSATETLHRAFLYGDSQVNDRQYFYEPRLEIVDGREPSILTLIRAQRMIEENRLSINSLTDVVDTVSSYGNKLNLEDWTAGTGTLDELSAVGDVNENNRDWGLTPYEERGVLWEGSPNGNGGYDGGWQQGQLVEIDHTQSYRFSVWLKKTNSQDGRSFFGPTYIDPEATDTTNTLARLDGTAQSNPYFWAGDLPELDKWYLLVGYVHGSQDTSTTNYGKIYDGETGLVVPDVALTDFKFQTSNTRVGHRVFLFDDPNTSDRQYFYAPRIDELNGNEPSIAGLLGISQEKIETYVEANVDAQLSGTRLAEAVDKVSDHGNKLNLRDWSVGTGSIDGIIAAGLASENSRDWGLTPHNERGLLWEAIPSGDGDYDGGWQENLSFEIDHTKMYRYSIWLKKTNSQDGKSYFGSTRVDPSSSDTSNTVTSLDGSLVYNPYFWVGDLPELDKWYLLVGYVHGSEDTSTTSYGKMYDGETGAIVTNATFTDFKFQTGSTRAGHRMFLLDDLNVNDRQYFYAPRVDEVNGSEPSIASLLGITNSSGDSGDSSLVYQTLSVDGNELTISGTGGNTVTLPSSGGDSTDELITSITLDGATLRIDESGNSKSVDLSSIAVDAVDDADADPLNETNTGFSLNGNTLELSDAAGTLTVNLETIASSSGTSLSSPDGTTLVNAVEALDSGFVRVNAPVEASDLTGKAIHAQGDVLIEGDLQVFGLTRRGDVYMGQFGRPGDDVAPVIP